MTNQHQPANRLLILIGTIITLILVVWVISYFNLFSPRLVPGQVSTIPTATTPTDTTQPSPITSVPYVIEEVTSGLVIPWSIAFTSPDRMLVTERPGRLRVIEKNKLQPQPLHTFPEIATAGEEGLMSIAIDPDYRKNKWIYLSLAYNAGADQFVKVVRFDDLGTKLANQFVVIDKIPAAKFHAGCRIAFGPDGMLYISTGDAFDRELAQVKTSLAGKILRLHKDGKIPADNPIAGSPLWSYGHRNPQGIAWHPVTGQMYSSEHGPSVIDGPAGGDEINRIIKNANYGWPLVSHEKTLAGTVAPIKLFTPAEAPASLLIYSGNALPQFKNNLFFGALVGTGLIRLTLDATDPDKITSVEKLTEVKYGRIREVVQGPDGFIYFSTSNRDGRGKPVASDDRIFRLRPAE